VQPACGPPEALRLGDRHEVAQVSEFHGPRTVALRAS
jgi:hypothetical protein